MPPKNNKKKDSKPRELTEHDMRRMGMTEEDIARIVEEKRKQEEAKKNGGVTANADESSSTSADEERRAKKRVKQIQEELQKLENVEEGRQRVLVMTEEEEASRPLFETLSGEKKLRLREFAVYTTHRRTEEARRKQEAERQAYMDQLQSRTQEERDAFVENEKRREEERFAEELQREKERKEKEQRLAEKRAAKLAALRAKKLNGEDGEDLDPEGKDNAAEAAAQKKRVGDDLQEKMLSQLGFM